MPYTFTCEYSTTDGRRWGVDISASSWADAIALAEPLGLVITGVLISVHPADTADESWTIERYNGEECPPCPIALRNHPVLRRRSAG